jgi:hypothetical protein
MAAELLRDVETVGWAQRVPRSVVSTASIKRVSAMCPTTSVSTSKRRQDLDHPGHVAFALRWGEITRRPPPHRGVFPEDFPEI